MCIYTYIHICMYVYIYIYIERERDVDLDIDIAIDICSGLQQPAWARRRSAASRHAANLPTEILEFTKGGLVKGGG